MDRVGRQSERVWLAEWNPHEGTWLSWPHNRETWPHNLSKAQDEFETLIRYLAEREEVRLIVGADQLSQVRSRGIDRIKGVSVWPFPTNDAWVRDYGPTAVLIPPSNNELLRERETCFVDWQYNAWGNKYPPFDEDQRVARRCADWYGCLCDTQSIVLEGGAIEGNGHGVLLTTESCLREANRNPQMSRADLDDVLREVLGVHTVLWLPGGDFAGDDTNGHIDQIARFVNKTTLLISTESDTSDANYATFNENRSALERGLALLELPHEIVELPLPGEVKMFGARLPASYSNFIFSNDALIVPQFHDGRDKRALGIFRDLLPGRDVVGLPCRELVVGLGAWHCLSQQHCCPEM